MGRGPRPGRSRRRHHFQSASSPHPRPHTPTPPCSSIWQYFPRRRKEVPLCVTPGSGTASRAAAPDSLSPLVTRTCHPPISVPSRARPGPSVQSRPLRLPRRTGPPRPLSSLGTGFPSGGRRPWSRRGTPFAAAVPARDMSCPAPRPHPPRFFAQSPYLRNISRLTSATLLCVESELRIHFLPDAALQIRGEKGKGRLLVLTDPSKHRSLVLTLSAPPGPSPPGNIWAEENQP